MGGEYELHLELGDVVIDGLGAGVLVLEQTLDRAQRPATPSDLLSPIYTPTWKLCLLTSGGPHEHVEPKTLLHCPVFRYRKTMC